jgi:hypothetical protein
VATPSAGYKVGEVIADIEPDGRYQDLSFVFVIFFVSVFKLSPQAVIILVQKRPETVKIKAT